MQNLSPESQIPPVQWSQATRNNRPHAIPPLSRRAAILLYPLTKEGRRKLPLWYLVRQPYGIRRAPKGSPLGERMRRLFEALSISLWWPIGKALSIMLVWYEKPAPQAVLAWWKALDADRHNPRWSVAANRSVAMSDRLSQALRDKQHLLRLTYAIQSNVQSSGTRDQMT